MGRLGHAIRKGGLLTALSILALSGNATGGIMELTQERVRELFEYREDGALVWKNNNRETCQYVGPNGYRMVGVDGGKHTAHKIVFLWHNGYVPKVIDHKNRIRIDNRIENLRECSFSENNFNTAKRNNRSGKVGVFFRKDIDKWQAYIHFDGKKKSQGCFSTFKDAVEARREAEIKYYGEYSPA